MSVQTILQGKRTYRELAVEPPKDSLPAPLPVPEGMRAWRNRKNDFVVVVCHYTADPEKRSDDWYTAACKNLREDQIERELEINFDSKAGSKAFPFLEHNETHFRRDPPYPIPSHWKIVAGLDYGSRNPTSVHWYAIDEWRRFWAFDEFYCPMQELQGGLAAFAEYLKKHPYYPRTRFIVADPSMFNKGQNVLETKENGRESYGTLMSVADLLSKAPLSITKLQRANNDRVAGLTRVHQMLNWRENISDEHGQPYLFVGKRCNKLWWELTNLVYKIDDNPDKNSAEDVVKRNDHAFDELKYALLSQDLPSESAPPENKAGRYRLKDIEDEIDEAYAKENENPDDELFLNMDESFREDMESEYAR